MPPSPARRRKVWAGVIAAVTALGLATSGASAAAAPAKKPAAGKKALQTASTKKGLASRYLLSDPARVSDVRVGWSYNWRVAADAVPAGVEFVPMIWGPRAISDARIEALTEGGRSGQYRHLLGFNEPDAATQSNMTPEEAIALWPRLESTGLRLGSPAPAVATRAWLDRFMALAAAKRYRVDFIALHFYQDFTHPQAVSNLRRTLERIYAKHGKPIWVTEIGTYDVREWGATMYAPPSAYSARKYMRAALALLESLPYVERYAWAIDRCPEAACRFSRLFDDSDALTGRGKLYKELGRTSAAATTGRSLVGRATGRCTQIAGGSRRNATLTQIGPCSGRAGQLWQRRSNGTVAALGKCLEVRPKPRLSTVVQTNACTSAKNQKWRWLRDGRLYHPQTQRCLGVKKVGAAKGVGLGVQKCSEAPGQRWALM